MRLVRVTTQNPQSRFDGTLSADLDIAPGSKIALKSLSLEQKDNVISVDVNTDTVSYTQGATTYTAQLDHDDYTVNTYPTLLLDMETKLNATAAYIPGTGDTRIQGMEYRVGVDDDHKFQLQARKGDVGEQPNNWDLEEDIVYDTNPLNETNQYAVDAVVPDGNCQTMKVNARMPNGNGYCSAMAARLEYDATKTEQSQSGFWVCATYEDISALTPTELSAFVSDPLFITTFCAWGVGLQRLNTGDFRYLKIEDGVASTIADHTSTYADGAANNPWLRLQRSAGKMYACYEDEDGNSGEVQLASNPGDEVYQFIVYWNNNANVATGLVEASLSAFDKVIRVEAMKLAFVDSVGNNPGDVRTNYRRPRGMQNSVAILYEPNYERTANVFDFESLAMATDYGFTTTSVPATGTFSSINFVVTATDRFGPRIVADALIVVSDNLPLASYDTTKVGSSANGQKRSILDVVPIPYGNEGIVAYQPSMPTFIDLNNATTIPLRNIKFRIVDGDYNIFVLDGLASLVFLIKGPDEN